MVAVSVPAVAGVKRGTIRLEPVGGGSPVTVQVRDGQPVVPVDVSAGEWRVVVADVRGVVARETVTVTDGGLAVPADPMPVYRVTR